LRRVFIISAPLAAILLAGLGWAAFVPLDPVASREEPFEIPKGTYARRRAGDLVDILPSRIRLTLGRNDVLLLRNLDDVPQVFGPTILMPGQSFRLPFEKAADYEFACTAHSSGQMQVIVDEAPVTPWTRLRYRAIEMWEK
jgi:hypothetical protein